MQTVGKRIREARRQAGLSQEELAKAIGKYGRKLRLVRSTVAQWETGSTENIEAANLLCAAKVLGVTASWLQFGREL